MNIVVYGKNAADIIGTAQEYGLTVVQNKPDVVVSYGGDGTLLAAERDFPGIPKLPIRDSKVCLNCPNHTKEVLLKALCEGTLVKVTQQKLTALYHDETRLALNEVIITNPLPIHAVRFTVAVNGNTLSDKVLIGDGVIAATPIGATGYFKSVTRQTFAKDFGLAFNNAVDPIDPIFFTAAEAITVTIIRGPAILTVDNDPRITEISEQATITIKAAQNQAFVLAPDTLQCPNCIVKRDERLD